MVLSRLRDGSFGISLESLQTVQQGAELRNSEMDILLIFHSHPGSDRNTYMRTALSNAFQGIPVEDALDPHFISFSLSIPFVVFVSLRHSTAQLTRDGTAETDSLEYVFRITEKSTYYLGHTWSSSLAYSAA
ncbi:hypothetical protein A0H81_11251 [Grifola frondosa]|uniref:Uncharacterized protein n=1 Tax=Grifola frondosa TaxID=5627 RepID=A0A1C7LWZ9_GRIFR|nr:hypothetical protein A0H81_11251 [Grifola frondosa]